MVIKALLTGLLASLSMLGHTALGGSMLNRPLVVAPIAGLIFGDLQTGIIMGATLELIFLGVVSIGGATPSDATMGSILGTAFAIHIGKGPEIALTLAVPIGLLSQALKYGIYFVRAAFMDKADEYADKGNEKAIVRLHFGLLFLWIIVYGFIAFAAILFGAEAMEGVLNKIPQIIIDGLEVASGMLPAVGFALLINMLWTKKLAVFLLFGFALSAYLNLPIMGIAIFGTIIAVIITIQDMSVKRFVTDTSVANGEEDFFNE